MKVSSGKDYFLNCAFCNKEKRVKKFQFLKYLFDNKLFFCNRDCQHNFQRKFPSQYSPSHIFRRNEKLGMPLYLNRKYRNKIKDLKVIK